MAVEIKTSGVKPLRNTFSHLAARFGDKPATRYQEIAFDTQPTTNFHYRPLWAPEQELYDTSTTAIEMSDWYTLKDPRKYYYGSWTTTRAKQQDAIDQQLAFTEKRDLFILWPEDARNLVIYALLPLRHYEWGGNTNNNFIAAYGYGTTITQAATMGMCDRLGMAQFISRIGLCIDGKTGASLEQARNIWLSDPAWQGLRREVESLFVVKDWFELMVAQNLVADSIVYQLFFTAFDQHFGQRYGNDLSPLIDYVLTWQKDFSRWVDAVIKTAAAESPENTQLLNDWVTKWYSRLTEALKELSQQLYGENASELSRKMTADFNGRLKKIGLDPMPLC